MTGHLRPCRRNEATYRLLNAATYRISAPLEVLLTVCIVCDSLQIAAFPSETVKFEQ
jgi:hypothetical protein